MVSVAIIDDHRLVISGIQKLIETEPDLKVVGTAVNRATALPMLERESPDIVLLDISMENGENGIDLIPEIKKILPDSKIIVLTMHEEQYFFHKAVEEGVNGFLIKKAVGMDLIYAINVVSRGETYIYHSFVDKLIHEKNKPSRNKSQDELLWDKLSEREQQVMVSIAQGLTNKEIANKYSLSEKTIGTYRVRGLEKLGFTSKSDLVEFLFVKLDILKMAN